MQISYKTKGILSYDLIPGSVNNSVILANFYIFAPVINTAHRLITIDIETIEDFKVILWPFENKSIPYNVKIDSKNYLKLEDKICEILNDDIVKEIFTKLVAQIRYKWQIENQKYFS